jgi:hypothetical protein
MSKSCVMLICVLSVGFAGASKATPPDPSDVVIVDGLPCNRLCRSYLAWSRELSSRPQSEQLAPKVIAPGATGSGEEKSNPEAYAGGSRPLLLHPSVVRRAKTAGLRPAAKADSNLARGRTADSHPKAVAGSETKPTPEKPDVPPAASASTAAKATPANVAGTLPKVDAATGTDPKTTRQMPPAKPEELPAAAKVTADSKIMPASTADAHARAGSDVKTIPQQAAAAEPVSTVAALSIADAKKIADADTAASTPSSTTGVLVAILIARPEIKSVSDLSGKSIAIDAGHSASNGNVKTAIVAAGAADVQLSEGQAKAVDRLIGGEVPAALVALVSPKAAQGFSDIADFKTFRILFWPGSSKAQLEKP